MEEVKHETSSIPSKRMRNEDGNEAGTGTVKAVNKKVKLNNPSDPAMKKNRPVWGLFVKKHVRVVGDGAFSPGLEMDADLYIYVLNKIGIDIEIIPAIFPPQDFEKVIHQIEKCEVLVGFEIFGELNDVMLEIKRRKSTVKLVWIPNLEVTKNCLKWKPTLDHCELFDVIVAKTKGMIKVVEQFAKSYCPGSECKVVQHATLVSNLERKENFFNLDDRKGIIHFAGSSYNKNTLENCLAGIKLIKRYPDKYNILRVQICFWPTGPGQNEGTIEKLKQLKKENPDIMELHIGGYISENEKVKLYCKSRLALCASKTEGFGHYIVEALAYGCGVVTTDGVPMRDIGFGSRTVSLAEAKEVEINFSLGYYVGSEDIAKAAEELPEYNRAFIEETQEIYKNICEKSFSDIISLANLLSRKKVNAEDVHIKLPDNTTNYNFVEKEYSNNSDGNLIEKIKVGERNPQIGYDESYVFNVFKSDKFIRRRLLKGYLHDKEVVMAMWNYLKPGSVLLDIGANIGTQSIPLASRVTNSGAIYAFEPQSKIFGLLKKNIEENKFSDIIFANNLAVGHRIGSFNLSDEIRDDYSKPVKLNYSGENSMNYGGVQLGLGGEEVQMTTVDEFVSNLEKTKGQVKLKGIKVDVEGAESLVFYGAQKTIEKYHPFIVFECNRKRLEEAEYNELKADADSRRFDILYFCEKLGYNKIIYLKFDNYMLLHKYEPLVTEDRKFQVKKVRSFPNTSFRCEMQKFVMKKPQW